MGEHDPVTASRLGRRDALKLGGLTVSLAAFAAACGDDLGGDTDPGRVGYAPPITNPPTYDVDDAVLLRTISSVELTIIATYGRLTEIGAIDADQTELVAAFTEHHQRIADEMGELTASVGGDAWTCTNDWMTDRLVDPLLAAIESSDDASRDGFNAVVALENLATATNQSFATRLVDADAASAALAAAVLEARQSAAIVSVVRGPEGFVSPALAGEDPEPGADGVPVPFAVPSVFGSTGQIELVAGPADENGVRQTFVLQTPAENSYVYNELEPSC